MSSFLKNVLRTLTNLASGFLFLQAAMEFYKDAPGMGSRLGSFSPLWGIAFLAFMVFCLLLFLWITSILWFPGITNKIMPKLIKVRNKMGIVRWPIAVAAVVLPPIFFLFTKLLIKL